MFSPVSWQWYLLTTQNDIQSAKIRTVNAVTPVLKPENERFRPILGNGSFDRLKITFKVLKKTQLFRKKRFKTNERFRPYLGNDTFH